MQLPLWYVPSLPRFLGRIDGKGFDGFNESDFIQTSAMSFDMVLGQALLVQYE